MSIASSWPTWIPGSTFGSRVPLVSQGVIGGHWGSLEVIGGHWVGGGGSLEVIGGHWGSLGVIGGHWRSLVFLDTPSINTFTIFYYVCC